LILAYQGLEEENLDQKNSPAPPGWWLVQQASPLLIGKETKVTKKPTGRLE